MADDIVLRLGADLQNLQAGLRQAEQRLVASLRSMEQAIRVNTARMSRGFDQLEKAAGETAKAQQENAQASREAAAAVNTPEIDQGTQKWLALAAAVGSAAGAYLGARSAAQQLEREQEGLISQAARLAAAYLSVRQTYRGFLAIIQQTSAIEQQRVQLEGLFRSAALGEQAFQWVRTFPVQAQGFGDALAILQGFNVGDVFNRLRILNDTVLTLGDETGKLERVSRQLGQAFGQNALRAEELNSLIDNGIPVFSVFEEALGKSALEIRQMASEGRLGREELERFFAVLERRFAGGAERQLETFGGLLEVIRRQFREFIAEIGQAGVFDFVKEQLQGLIDEIQRLRDTGQLSEIARNIGDSIKLIAEALGNNLRELIRAFAEFAGSERVVTVAGAIAAALTALVPVTAFAADNLDTLAIASAAFFAAIEIAKLSLLVAGIGSVITLLLRYRAAILIGITATRAFIAAMVSGAIGAARFAAALAFIRTALLTNLVIFGGVAGALALLAGGLFLAFTRTGRLAAEQQRLARELRESEAAARSFTKILRESDDLGLDAVRERIRLLNQQRIAGDLTASQALQQARALFQEVSDLRKQEEELTKRLAGVQQQIRTQIEENAKQAILETLEVKRRAIDQEIRESEQRARALIQQERQLNDQIASLRRDLTESQRSAEEQLIDARRQALPEFLQAFEREREIATRLREVQEQLAAARAAETEEARAAALANAQGAQQRAQSLAKQIEDQFRFRRALEQTSTSEQQIIRTKIDLAERDRDANLQAQEAEQERFRELGEDLKDVVAEIERIKSEDVIIKLVSNAKDIQDDLRDVRRELEAVERQARETNRALQFGDVPGLSQVPGRARGGFAASGWIRGSGGGRDTIPILVGAGEAILNRHQQQYVNFALRSTFGHGLRELFSLVRTPHTAPMSRIRIPAVFASGGFATPPSGGNREETITININAAGRRAQVQGTRDQARALADALNHLARAV